MDVGERLCSTCLSLNLRRHDFTDPPFKGNRDQGETILEGTLGGLRKTQACPLCRLILDTLQHNERGQLPIENSIKWTLLWSQNNPEYEPVTVDVEEKFGSGLYANFGLHGQREYRIELVDEASTSCFLRGRLLNEDGVDLEQIRSWIRLCRERHGDEHKRLFYAIPVHPQALPFFRVIDVQKRCLVPLPPGSEYVALSYVWGSTNKVLTTMANLAEFSTERAFAAMDLPQTIRDAENLTRDLGLSYLWIDSLCIVQDDKRAKGVLISNMDCIYGHAYLTIVAATGNDADAGLPGFRKGSWALRKLHVETITPDLRLGVLPHFDVELMESFYAKRAWTFQEGCLSARCLVFLNEKVYFSCQEALWREDVAAETPDIKPGHGASALGRNEYPTPMQHYGELVCAYSERNLTFQSDKLNAFAGLAKAISHRLNHTKMWYGLPAAVFDWALLWEGNRPLSRRNGFPSWSWAGVLGSVTLPMECGVENEQNWLLNRSWIDWYIIEGKLAAPALAWDPDRDGTTISGLLSSSDKAEHSSNGDIESERDGNYLAGAPAEGGMFDTGKGNGSDDDKGSESDDHQSDSDYYDERCPTYGESSPSNPYGRRLPLKMPPQFPSEPPTKSFLTTLPSCPPGTLCFSTISAYFLVSSNPTSPTDPKFSPSTAYVLDSDYKRCGFIRGHTLRPTLPSQPQPFELLFLSFASPGSIGALTGTSLQLDAEYAPLPRSANVGPGNGEMLLGEWHPWDFLNVMLVVPFQVERDQKGDEALSERVGIGVIHANALTRAVESGPCWRDVFLY